MSTNIAKTNNNIEEKTVIKAGEYSYSRKYGTIKAYGQEYQLPVRTIEFSDKLTTANEAIAKALNARDTVEKIKNGIGLFIGETEAERIFPAEKLGEVDIDEISGFWVALNFELGRSQNELIARYAVSKAIRI